MFWSPQHHLFMSAVRNSRTFSESERRPCFRPGSARFGPAQLCKALAGGGQKANRNTNSSDTFFCVFCFVFRSMKRFMFGRKTAQRRFTAGLAPEQLLEEKLPLSFVWFRVFTVRSHDSAASFQLIHMILGSLGVYGSRTGPGLVQEQQVCGAVLKKWAQTRKSKPENRNGSRKDLQPVQTWVQVFVPQSQDLVPPGTLQDWTVQTDLTSQTRSSDFTRSSIVGCSSNKENLPSLPVYFLNLPFGVFVCRLTL